MMLFETHNKSITTKEEKHSKKLKIKEREREREKKRENS